MVGKVGDTDTQGQADRLQKVPCLELFQRDSSCTFLFQVVSAVVEELLQPKLNGLKAKAN